MRAYSVFDRETGPKEGAILVFAPTAKKARSMSVVSMRDMFDCGLCDTTVHWLEGMEEELRRQNGVPPNTPSVVESPVTCERCEEWGRHLDAQLVCDSCREDEADL